MAKMASPDEQKVPVATPDNLDIVCKELGVVKYKWFQIGVQLGVPLHILKEFRKEEDPFATAIYYWLCGNVERIPVSWTSLVKALKSSYVDEPGLARRIKKKYGVNLEGFDNTAKCSGNSDKESTTSSGSSTFKLPSISLEEYYPYLFVEDNKEKISEENKLSLRHELDQHTMKLKRTFAGIAFELQEHIIYTYTLDKLSEVLRLLKDAKLNSIVAHSSDTQQIFKELYPYISFFDFNLIKHLAKNLGSDSIKLKLKKYKGMFDRYSKQRVCECPSDAFGDVKESEKVLVFITDNHIGQLTVEQLLHLKYEISQVLNIKLRLLRIEKGCVKLTFRAFEAELEEMPLKLAKLGVQSIKYGKVEWKLEESTSSTIIDSAYYSDGCNVKAGSGLNKPQVPVISLFPYFEADERSLLKLKKDTNELKRQFDQIVFELQQFIISSGALGDAVALLSEKYLNFESLLKSCPTSEVFKRISRHYSFFDYDVIRHIRNFGSNSFKMNFQKYIKKFQEFSKRQVCKCPSDAFGDFNNSEPVFRIETIENVNTFTLEELKKLKSEMVKIMGNIFSNFLSLKVKESSMELTFRAMEGINPLLSQIQKIALRTLGITGIIYGSSVKTRTIFQTGNVESLSEIDIGYSNELGVTEKFSESYGLTSESHLLTIDETRSFESYKDKELSDLRIDLMMTSEKVKTHTPFFAAIHHGDLLLVKDLIQTYNPMTKDSFGNSCLHYAVQSQKFEILKYLIEEVELPPGTLGTNGATILHMAVASNNLKAIEYLVESEMCKLDPITEDDDGLSAIYYACKGGHFKAFCYLIEHVARGYMTWDHILYDNSTPSEPSLFDKIRPQDFSRSPLCCASYCGHLRIVQYLVEECGCDPTRPQGKHQLTPIQCAIVRGDLRTVKYLAESKPGCLKPEYNEIIKLKQLFPISPLHLASLCGDLRVVKYCLTVKTNNSDAIAQAMIYAALNGKLEVIKYLIDDYYPSKGLFSPEVSNFDLLKTAFGISTTNILHIVATKGHVDILHYLVKQKGMNPLCSDAKNGYTALHYAAIHDQIEVVKYLIEEVKLPPATEDKSGGTILHMAVAAKNLKMIEYLLQSPIIESKTAIFYACQGGYYEGFRFLIEHVASVFNMPWNHILYDDSTPSEPNFFDEINAQDFSKSPLCCACYCGHIRIVKYLVEKCGCDPTRPQSKHHLTPIQCAIVKGDVRIVKYLVKSRVSRSRIEYSHVMKLKHLFPRSPLHLASLYGDLHVLKFCLSVKEYSHDEKEKAMYYSVLSGKLEVMKYLINDHHISPMIMASKFPEFLARNPYQTTDYEYPLHIAAKRGHIDIVHYLVKHKSVDPSCCNQKNGFTALHYAVMHNRVEVVKFLTEVSPFLPLAKNYYNKTPLDIAKGTSCAKYLQLSKLVLFYLSLQNKKLFLFYVIFLYMLLCSFVAIVGSNPLFHLIQLLYFIFFFLLFAKLQTEDTN